MNKTSLTTNERDNLLQVIPYIVKLLSNPDISERLAHDGLKVDYIAFSDMIERLTGKALIVEGIPKYMVKDIPRA